MANGTWIRIGNWIHFTPTTLRYNPSVWRYRHPPLFTVHRGTSSAASQTVSSCTSGIWKYFLAQLELSRLASLLRNSNTNCLSNSNCLYNWNCLSYSNCLSNSNCLSYSNCLSNSNCLDWLVSSGTPTRTVSLTQTV
jgi:hypothetical protein